jgi:hypothetical protein
MKKWKKVNYIGEPCRTRGEFGECIKTGRMDPDEYIYIWDGDYGWTIWGRYNPTEWEMTNEPVDPVTADW